MQTMKQWRPAGILIACSIAALMPVAAMAAQPTISGFNNVQVPLGANLIIYGSSFGTAQGRSYVLIGGRQVPVLAWSDVAINLLVNPQAFSSDAFTLDTAYPVQIVVPAASTPKSATVNLMITSGPLVTGYLGSTFATGSALTIYGARFGATQGAGSVSMTVIGSGLNGALVTTAIPLAVKTWADNTINAQIVLPNGAALGYYTLTVNRADGGTCSCMLTIIAK
jgi:hypothetical protein